jgi:hypothetical protein
VETADAGACTAAGLLQRYVHLEVGSAGRDNDRVMDEATCDILVLPPVIAQGIRIEVSATNCA